MDHSINYYVDQANLRSTNEALETGQLNLLKQFFSTEVGSQYINSVDQASATIIGKTTLIPFSGRSADGTSMQKMAFA